MTDHLHYCVRCNADMIEREDDNGNCYAGCPVCGVIIALIVGRGD